MFYELWDRAQAKRVGRFFSIEDAYHATRAYLLAAEAISQKFTLELLEMERGYKGHTVAAFEQLAELVREAPLPAVSSEDAAVESESLIQGH